MRGGASCPPYWLAKSSKTTARGSMLFRKSECLLQLTSLSRQKYIKKITKAGLSCDPYCLESSEWNKDPEDLPLLSWSDITMFMVSTPSPYTKESIKVSIESSESF